MASLLRRKLDTMDVLQVVQEQEAVTEEGPVVEEGPVEPQEVRTRLCGFRFRRKMDLYFSRNLILLI